MMKKLLSSRLPAGAARVGTLSTLLLFIACASFANSNTFVASVYELVLFPDRFQEKTVAVKGYLKSSSGLFLFVSEDHSKMRDFQSSIAISDTVSLEISESNCVNMYAEVTGTFASSAVNGDVIFDVSRIRHPSSGKTCWESS